MPPAKPQRVSIAFQGGQVLATRVAAKDLTALQRALEKGAGGWHELVAEDGTVRLDLGNVVYVRIESDEPRVGFGA